VHHRIATCDSTELFSFPQGRCNHGPGFLDTPFILFCTSNPNLYCTVTQRVPRDSPSLSRCRVGGHWKAFPRTPLHIRKITSTLFNFFLFLLPPIAVTSMFLFKVRLVISESCFATSCLQSGCLDALPSKFSVSPFVPWHLSRSPFFPLALYSHLVHALDFRLHSILPRATFRIPAHPPTARREHEWGGRMSTKFVKVCGFTAGARAEGCARKRTPTTSTAGACKEISMGEKKRGYHEKGTWSTVEQTVNNVHGAHREQNGVSRRSGRNATRFTGSLIYNQMCVLCISSGTAFHQSLRTPTTLHTRDSSGSIAG
jgi:hypothetical protein